MIGKWILLQRQFSYYIFDVYYVRTNEKDRMIEIHSQKERERECGLTRKREHAANLLCKRRVHTHKTKTHARSDACTHERKNKFSFSPIIRRAATKIDSGIPNQSTKCCVLWIPQNDITLTILRIGLFSLHFRFSYLFVYFFISIILNDTSASFDIWPNKNISFKSILVSHFPVFLVEVLF